MNNQSTSKVLILLGLAMSVYAGRSIRSDSHPSPVCQTADGALKEYIMASEYNEDSCQLYQTYVFAGCLCDDCPDRIPAVHLQSLADFCSTFQPYDPMDAPEQGSDFDFSTLFDDSAPKIEPFKRSKLPGWNVAEPDNLDEELEPIVIEQPQETFTSALIRTYRDGKVEQSGSSQGVWVNGLASQEEVLQLIAGEDPASDLVIEQEVTMNDEDIDTPVKRIRAPRKALIDHWDGSEDEDVCDCNEDPSMFDSNSNVLMRWYRSLRLAVCQAFCAHSAAFILALLTQMVVVSVLTILGLQSLHERMVSQQQKLPIISTGRVLFASDAESWRNGYEPLLQ